MIWLIFASLVLNSIEARITNLPSPVLWAFAHPFKSWISPPVGKSGAGQILINFSILQSGWSIR